MAKKLMINCATCDTRKALEENYTHYEAITINAATVLTNAQGKVLLNSLPITLNCADVLEVEEDVELRTINGKGEIKSSDMLPDKKQIMMVNGSLTIDPDTRKQVENYVSITVNGSVIYPESMAACLGSLKVNGSTTCYPDGAIILKRNAVIDKLFALRAKKSLYWAAKRMIMVDPELDGKALMEKGASFCAKEVIIAQSKVEEMLQLIDEKAEIKIVPDGTAVVLDDLTLDETALHRYGKRLYVVGDVTVPGEKDCLDAVEYLEVRGDAKVPQERKAALLQAAKEIAGEVKTAKPRGAALGDKPYLKITKWMLEQQPMGVEVSDCAVVKIEQDISKEMILKRLEIRDCGVVKCSRDQEDAVEMICEDVGQIKDAEGEDGAGSTIKAALGGFMDVLDTKIINAADFVM